MATVNFNWTLPEVSQAVLRERESEKNIAIIAGQPQNAETHKLEVLELARRIYSRSRLQRRYRQAGSIF